MEEQGSDQRESQEKFVELVAPEYLSPDQNLLDQPPFNSIFQETVSQTKITEGGCRILLLGVVGEYKAKPEFYGGPEDGGSEHIGQQMTECPVRIFRMIQRIRILRKKEFGGLHDFAALVKATKLLGSALARFPYWYEYISSQKQVYSKKGEPVQDENFSPARSYASWAVRKTDRKSRSVLLGIEEVFPQDFSGTTQEPIVPSHGESSQNRRWKILKASELVRKT